MQYTEKDIEKLIQDFTPEWTRRSQVEMNVKHGKGCFIWDEEAHSRMPNTGMFYGHGMLPGRFHKDMVKGLQALIDQADPESEVVVALIFNGKAHGRIVKKN